MTSTIPADLLKLKDRFETWRTSLSRFPTLTVSALDINMGYACG
jgi:hypothetical protein